MSDHADARNAAPARDLPATPATPAAPSAARRVWSRVIGRLAGLSDDETQVSTRGFAVDQPEVVERLESIGRHFAWGYNHALVSCELAELARALATRPADDAGFAYEGAAMGLVIADWMTPGRRMFEAYVEGPARPHEYMAWVGLGWALARLPVSPLRALSRYRNLNKWLALDGYGFHDGYFNWRRSVVGQRRPRGLTAGAARVFDQGLGRSLWFVRGANPGSVAAAIAAFDAARHGDLWAGVGLAATYAGGAAPTALRTLLDRAGPHAAALAQGVVFAAQARRLAGNPVAHTELACAELLGMSSIAAADIALQTLPTGDDSLPAYQHWRLAIQQRCAVAQTISQAHSP